MDTQVAIPINVYQMVRYQVGEVDKCLDASCHIVLSSDRGSSGGYVRGRSNESTLLKATKDSILLMPPLKGHSEKKKKLIDIL